MLQNGFEKRVTFSGGMIATCCKVCAVDRVLACKIGGLWNRLHKYYLVNVQINVITVQVFPEKYMDKPVVIVRTFAVLLLSDHVT